MYEHLASLGGGPPNKAHLSLYSKWSEGGWGMIITGNVQVTSTHLTLGRDTCCPNAQNINIQPFEALSRAMHGSQSETTRPLAIMQLSHAGRQSPRFIGGRPPWKPPLRASSIPVGERLDGGILSKLTYGIMFQKPKAMRESDITEVIAQFQ